MQKLYHTTDPLASPGAVKVSRKYVLRAIENGDVILGDFSRCQVVSQTSDAVEYTPEMLQRVTEIVAKVLDIDPASVTPEAHVMLDLGADSMQYFAILTALAEEFSLTSSEKETL